MEDSFVAPRFQAPRIKSFVDKENELRAIRRNLSEKNQTQRRFFYGRVGALTNLLKHRHSGSCDTADADAWFEIVMPFIAKANVLSGKSAEHAVFGWCRRFLPGFTQRIGIQEINRRIDAAISDPDVPDMDTIVGTLQLTWEEGRAVKLRGFRSINPPTVAELREHKRILKETHRRAEGVRPRSELTKTADLKADAACIGVSLRTLQNWIKAGDVVDRIMKKLTARASDCTKLSLSYLKGKYGRDTFVQFGQSANDDTKAERSA